MEQAVDARVNPEAANAVIEEALGNKPDTQPVLVEAPPDTQVTLPGGFIDPETGDVIKVAEVRELTGADEELLAKATKTNNLNRFITTLLNCGVVAVGDKPATPDLLKRMLVGDRDAMIMGIRQATYGDSIDMDLICPKCGNKIEITYSLSKDVPVRTLDDPADQEFTVTLRDGRKAEVRLVTGADQEAVFNQGAKTSAELNTLLLFRCVQTIAGDTVRVDDILRLGMKDRKTLIEAIYDRQPGPKYSEVKQECDSCGSSFEVPLDLADLFRG